MPTTQGATKSEVGGASVAGLALGPFAILFSVWIPTLAVILGSATIVAGALDLRGASGRRARFARLAIGLGILALVSTAVVVLVSLVGGPQSGDASATI